MTIVDETLLLRYLLDDDPTLSTQARDVIAKGGAMTDVGILARVISTLEKVYGVPRSAIGSAIDALIDDVEVRDGRDLRMALVLYRASTLSFFECLSAARHARDASGLEPSAQDAATPSTK